MTWLNNKWASLRAYGALDDQYESMRAAKLRRHSHVSGASIVDVVMYEIETVLVLRTELDNHEVY